MAGCIQQRGEQFNCSSLDIRTFHYNFFFLLSIEHRVTFPQGVARHNKETAFLRSGIFCFLQLFTIVAISFEASPLLERSVAPALQHAWHSKTTESQEHCLGNSEAFVKRRFYWDPSTRSPWPRMFPLLRISETIAEWNNG